MHKTRTKLDENDATPNIKSHIMARLSELEMKWGCKILMAAESGSRAWGFSSLDSDYDIRAVYVNPLDWYLRISAQTGRYSDALC